MKKYRLFSSLSALLCASLIWADNDSFWSERRQQSAAPNAPIATPPAPKDLSFRLINPAQTVFTPHGRRFAEAAKDPLVSGVLTSLSPQTVTVQNFQESPQKPSKGLVIYVQDIHMNLEAQKQISNMLSELIEKEQVGVVGLEAAFEPIDLTRFRTYEDKKAMKVVTDYLLKTFDITGPIHAALLSTKTIPPIIGIDDNRLYHANVDAYRISVKGKEKVTKKLNDIKVQVAGQKDITFSKRLREFDARMTAYHLGEADFQNYARALLKEADENGWIGVVATMRQRINRYRKLIDLEKDLPTAAVEKEKNRFSEKIIARFNPAQKALFERIVADVKADVISQADFSRQLAQLGREAGASEATYPLLYKYFDYVKEAEWLDATQLIDDLRHVEKKLYNLLPQNKREYQLAQSSRLVSLAIKLIDYELSAADWKEYEVLKTPDSVLAPLKNRLRYFEAFYVLAEERNKKMESEMFKAMQRAKRPVGVMVTGGFHSGDISHWLMSKGVSVLSVVPRLTQPLPANPSSYLEVFTRPPTPLDEFLEDIEEEQRKAGIVPKKRVP